VAYVQIWVLMHTYRDKKVVGLCAFFVRHFSGNIIFCSSRGGIFPFMRSIRTQNNVQVSCYCPLTELQRKLASKVQCWLLSVDSVIALTAGLHPSFYGQTEFGGCHFRSSTRESDQVMRIICSLAMEYGAPHQYFSSTS
jgi:uncharacterized membrane protein YhhN